MSIVHDQVQESPRGFRSALNARSPKLWPLTALERGSLLQHRHLVRSAPWPILAQLLLSATRPPLRRRDRRLVRNLGTQTPPIAYPTLESVRPECCSTSDHGPTPRQTRLADPRSGGSIRSLPDA